MTTTITKTVFFDAPPLTVWEFLTNKDKLGEWYHPAEADLTEGNAYTLVSTKNGEKPTPLITGKVITMQSPKKLVTTFIIAPFNGHETTITWELEEAAGGTRLTLTHEGIAEAAGDAPIGLLKALDHGWDEHFAKLRSSVADA